MIPFLMLLFVLSAMNLFGSQKKDSAQTSMEILAQQLKMDRHNKTIGVLLQPHTTQDENDRVDDSFKRMRRKFSRSALEKISQKYLMKDYSGAWSLVTVDIKKALLDYYRESAALMETATERAAAKKPDFIKQKEYALIAKMIKVTKLTTQMLESSGAKQEEGSNSGVIIEMAHLNARKTHANWCPIL